MHAVRSSIEEEAKKKKMTMEHAANLRRMNRDLATHHQQDLRAAAKIEPLYKRSGVRKDQTVIT